MSKKDPTGYYERFKAIVWGKPKPVKRRVPKRKVVKEAVKAVKEIIPKEKIEKVRIPTPEEIRALKEDYPERGGFYIREGKKYRTGMASVFTRKPFERDIKKNRQKALNMGYSKRQAEKYAHRRVPISERIINYWETGQREMSPDLALQFWWKRKQTDEYYRWFQDNYYQDPYDKSPMMKKERAKSISLEQAKAYAKKVWLERKKRGLKRLWLRTDDTP